MPIPVSESNLLFDEQNTTNLALKQSIQVQLIDEEMQEIV